MPRQRSGAVTAIAVLHLIGGGLGLIGSLCGGVGLLVSGTAGPGAPDPQAFLKQNIPMYMPVSVGQLLIGLVLDVLLLSAGIGLLNRQSWARYASIAYACISIPYKIFGLVWTLVFVNPAIDKLFAQAATTTPGFQAGFQFGRYFGLALSGLFILYPIAVLWVMLLPATKRELAPEGGRSRYDEDDRDDYDDRRRRRDDDDEDDDRRGGGDRYRERDDRYR